MKNKIMGFIFAGLILGCAFKGMGQTSSASYSTTLTIPPSDNTKKPMLTISSISSFEQIFPATIKNNKKISIVSASIESSDAVKKNLGLFKSIKMYLAMGDGSNEVLIASNNGISTNTGSSLTLNLNKNFTRDMSVRPDNIDPGASIDLVLAGLSGVQVMPGGGVRIRGVNTTGNGEPLYVVDGVERSNVQSLRAGDVESVEALKDASQLAMYGVKGANGVIKIKTKSGVDTNKKPAGSLENFVQGSSICVRFEYVLRYALKDETGLNVNVNFR